MLEADFTAASQGAKPSVTNRGEAFQSQFSVDDYGYVGDQQPYQVVYPSYPAPVWMKRYSDLNQALRECRTLCRLEGKPFRLVKWGKPVRSGCTDCGSRPTNRLPNVRGQAMGVLKGLDGSPRVARPVADVHPNGAMEVWDKDGRRARMVGEQNYVVSPQRAFRGEHKVTIPNYFDAVKSAQYLASHSGRRAYVCTRARCKDGKKWVAVAYVQPGGLSRDNKPARGAENVITPMTPNMMRQAQMSSRGGNILGQGS
jgi:hypothetical protein